MLGSISPFVIAVLKYAFIALIYFFVYRAIRAVAADISGGRKQRRAATPRPDVRAARTRGKAPQTIVVKDDSGRTVFGVRDVVMFAPVSALEHRARRPAARTVRRGVARKARRHHIRLVARVGVRAWIAIVVGTMDGSLRSPRPVVILGVEHGDVRVAERHVHDGERARRIRDLVWTVFGRELARHQVPATMRRLRGIELGNRGPIVRPKRVVQIADRLNFVQVVRVAAVYERRRRLRPELRRALDSERLHELPVEEEAPAVCRSIRARGRELPFVQFGARRRVEQRCLRAIVRPCRDDRLRRRSTRRNARVLRRAVCDGGERSIPLAIQHCQLRRKQPRQRIVCSDDGRRFG